MGLDLSRTLSTKKRRPKASLLLAEDEGFEPPQTESESGVLPLHKSSMALFRALRHKQHGYYSTERKKVKHYFPFLKDFFADYRIPRKRRNMHLSKTGPGVQTKSACGPSMRKNHRQALAFAGGVCEFWLCLFMLCAKMKPKHRSDSCVCVLSRERPRLCEMLAGVGK